jgi:polar amino acid transport system substrate-binding protein
MGRGMALTALIASTCLSLAAQTNLTFACAQGSASQAMIPLVEAVYAELKIEIAVEFLPAERGLHSANDGYCDGDIGRAAGSLAAFEALVFTTEELCSLKLKPWVRKDSRIRLASVEDLKKFHVAYVRGLKLAENFVAKAGIAAEVVADFPSLVKMLENARVDIVLSVEPAPYPALAEVAAALENKLATASAFHVLNRKHAALVPRFDAVLKAMKADGRYGRLTASR